MTRMGWWAWVWLLTIESAFAKVVIVKPGQSIQKAITQASAGDTIEVLPGEYRESLVIDKENITLRGKIQGSEWPILDGERTRNDGVIASGSGFTMEGFVIQRYKGNGVMTQGANRIVLRRLMVADTGIYGIYPTRGKNVLVEDTVSWGIADAAIYIGMCENVDVRRNEVHGNVAGIEIENSHRVLVENNFAHDNAGGILVFTLPGLPVKSGSDVVLRGNFVIDNNHVNFGPAGSLVANVPTGSGIVVLAADRVQIENNVIRGNRSGGILLSDLGYLSAVSTPDPKVEPNFDEVQILDNVFYRNGYQPDPKVRLLILFEKLSLASGDIVASGTGKNNCMKKGLGVKVIASSPFGECKEGTSSLSVKSRYAEKALGSHEETKMSEGEKVYVAVCSGCHIQGLQRIGPPVEEIQKKYKDNAAGIVAYATSPKKIRPGFPPMPSQIYLGRPKLEAVASYLLTLQ